MVDCLNCYHLGNDKTVITLTALTLFITVTCFGCKRKHAFIVSYFTSCLFVINLVDSFTLAHLIFCQLEL